jgi:uncharacterized integral membrane protein (TIGR00698 family)
MLSSTALPGLLVASALAGGALLVPGPASPLAVALVAGALLANPRPLPGALAPGMKVAAGTVMRVGVVLLGLSVTADAVRSLGWPVLLLVLVAVGSTLLVVTRLGAALGVRAPAALLVAAGFAICGTSAVSAVAPLTDARREEIAYAVGLVTLCGTLSVALLPLLQVPFGLSDAAFGIWVGAAVHDTGQVVAAAALAGEQSVTTAVVVKLVRVSLLAVLVTALATSGRGPAPSGRLHGLPPFVVAFAVAAALAAAGLVPDLVLEAAAPTRTGLLAVGMVGLGSAVQLSELRRLGLRPLVLGLLSWILLAGGTLLGVLAITSGHEGL